MTVTAELQATLATIPDVVNVAPRTVVALPPSDIDPVSDEMRVLVNGVLIYRAFDPGQAVVTGAPIPLVSMTGEALVTMTGDALVTTVTA